MQGLNKKGMKTVGVTDYTLLGGVDIIMSKNIKYTQNRRCTSSMCDQSLCKGMKTDEVTNYAKSK